MVLFSLIIIISIAFIAWASFSISSGIFLKAVCRNRKSERDILLTFDDGPDPVNTPLVLEILDKKGVKALFFINGSKALENPELLKNIFLKGHLIGNHTYGHSNFFPFYSRKRMLFELKKTSDIIENITGKRTLYFRPPFGVTNPSIAYAARELGLITIGWSVRSFDTFLKEKGKILSSVMKKVKGGDIVLFHDTVKGTVEMLDEFIVYCQKEGFELTVPEKFFLED
ncbi:MAG TPA: polysaccharide deacetylase family protein [bacterium]|jgi:peptidoglycan/xylan/chitin deacetylase (PgdA/CDA1 family)|nr:polysaccharide deacetylase family protein [bacterium]MDX9804412.1 polysaccharide deacetylase family protein [bacterium]HPG36821.1 polysaccharide deacetylase family protein [bacterium]HPM45613.1 polysaccharide deacetylase family protein [bacterium]HPY13280.1 polysaccharide deacetylase family protein [bacterium]